MYLKQTKRFVGKYTTRLWFLFLKHREEDRRKEAKKFHRYYRTV